MEIRFYIDPTTDLPHIYEHGLTAEEVTEVLLGNGEDLPAKRGSRMKLGQTGTGRYLQVIYVPDEDPNSVFAITSYELHGKGQDCLSPTATEEKAMSNAFPKGWNEERVRQVLAHYESQSEDEQFAEIEAALEQEDTIMMAIPAKLAPEVRALIARKQEK